MNWYWNDSIEESWSTWRKTGPDATLFTKNSVWTGMGSHLSLLSEGLVTNNLSHGMAFGDRGSMCVQWFFTALHCVNIQKNMVCPLSMRVSGPVIVSCKYGTEIFGSVIWGNCLNSWVTTSFSKILHHRVSWLVKWNLFRITELRNHRHCINHTSGGYLPKNKMR